MCSLFVIHVKISATVSVQFFRYLNIQNIHIGRVELKVSCLNLAFKNANSTILQMYSQQI